MYSEVRLEVPAHAELLAAVLTAVLPRRRRLARALSGRTLGGLGRFCLRGGGGRGPGGGLGAGTAARAVGGAPRAPRASRPGGATPCTAAVPLAGAEPAAGALAAAPLRSLVLGG